MIKLWTTYPETLSTRWSSLGRWLLMGLACWVWTSACAPALYNNITSLGRPTPEDDTPGLRGNITVAFINNTPYRAIFTFGTYDPQNTPQNLTISFPIEFQQFSIDSDPDKRLERDSMSVATAFTCGRAVSVGGKQLIELIKENELEKDDTDPEALKAGIAFSDRPLNDPEEKANQPTAGWTPGVLTLQGAEYQCDSLLVYTFEVDPNQPSGFRIDLDVILP